MSGRAVMFPRNRLAVKVLEPLAQSHCPALTAADWAIKTAIIAALVFGAYFMHWLVTGQIGP